MLLHIHFVIYFVRLLFICDVSEANERDFVKPLNKGTQPNIVLFLTDDQDIELGGSNHMPALNNLLRAYGAECRHAYVTTPLCCPSRSSMLTGRYTHNHHVFSNAENCSSEEWRRQNEPYSFAKLLQDRGYKTAYFGKYLNKYNGKYVPLGWSHWVGLLRNSRFYNYTLNVNGKLRNHGANYTEDYLTDVIVRESLLFVEQQARSNSKQPFLMVLSFPAPHGPEDSAPQFQNHFMGNHDHRTASWNVAPNFDKEWILANIEKMPALHQNFTDMLQMKRLQTLLSVDTAIENIIDSLTKFNFLNNTFVFYTSDHGYHLGQFGLLKGKTMPYEFDARVPMIIRGPGIPHSSQVYQPILNIDLAPTFLDLAGWASNSFERERMDGSSFLPVLQTAFAHRFEKERFSESNVNWRHSFLIERGRLNHRKQTLREEMENQKNHLFSKQGILAHRCRKNAFLRYPCKTNQMWYCSARKDGTGLRLRKCRVCQCSNRRIVPQQEKDEQQLNNENGGIADAYQQAYQNWLSTRHKIDRQTHALNLRMSMRITFENCRESAASSDEVDVLCGPYQSHSAWKYDKLKLRRAEEHLDGLLKRVKLLREAVNKERPSDQAHVCPCSKNASNIVTADEILQWNENQNVEKRQRKCKKKGGRCRRKNLRKYMSRQQCNKPFFNCFYHDNDHWKTPPLWTSAPICFCQNGINNTYWCLRTINSTHNFLYCEYITGFMSFYNLKNDPFQMKNMIYELNFELRHELHKELNKLRSCKGEKQCNEDIHSLKMPSFTKKNQDIFVKRYLRDKERRRRIRQQRKRTHA